MIYNMGIRKRVDVDKKPVTAPSAPAKPATPEVPKAPENVAPIVPPAEQSKPAAAPEKPVDTKPTVAPEVHVDLEAIQPTKKGKGKKEE